MIWVFIGLLAAVAVVALVRPLLRTPEEAPSRAAYDRTIFEDQLKEVDRDVERGVLTPGEADAARIEIQRRILAAAKLTEPTFTTTGSTMRKTTIALVGIAVPVLAAVIYFSVGSPLLNPTPSADEPGMAEINQMVDNLAAKVKENPKDPESVSMLARSYLQLGRFPDAVTQFKQLTSLQPLGVNFAALGEAATLANDNKVNKEAHDAFVKALVLDRGEPRARFYLGMEQLDKKEPKNAIAIWRDLIKEAPQGANWGVMVQEQLDSAAANSGIALDSVPPQHALALVPQDELSLAKVQTAGTPPALANALPGAKPTTDPAKDNGLPKEMQEQVTAMVASLAERLAKEPNDYNGWLMLGRSYTVLKNFKGAKDAYDKAMGLKPMDVEPRLQYLASIMTTIDPTDPGPLPKTVVDAADSVLKVNPNQAEALYVSGLARVKLGDGPGARKNWTQALQNLAPGSPLKPSLEQHLKSLE